MNFSIASKLKSNNKFNILALLQLALLFFISLIGTIVAGENLRLVQIPSDYSGINFNYDDGGRGKFDLPEIMGGGMAVADFNNDGRLDLFFCQGGPIETTKDAITADPPCVWYQNFGEMKFKNVSAKNAEGPSYAMGAWPADFNHDGKVDLFITGWRDWRLYQNLGNWRFQDVTEKLPGNPLEWSTVAVWADFNNDQHLDLFVGGYLKYDPSKAPFCAAPDGNRDYCGPEDFPAVPDRLYLNDGNGGFNDVTEEKGLNKADTGRALGAIAFDSNEDGRLDLFVANDGSANHLWVQDEKGDFSNQAVTRNVAFADGGEPLAGMGVAAIFVKGQKTPNLLVTNFLGRGTVLFESMKNGIFTDRSSSSGLQQATRTFNGFGIIAEDLDGDGLHEIIQANGHVLSRQRLGTPFQMPVAILSMDNQLKFQLLPAKYNPVADLKILGRGLIAADLDEDGRKDVIVSRLDGPPVILKNQSDFNAPKTKTISSPGKIFGGSDLSGYARP